MECNDEALILKFVEMVLSKPFCLKPVVSEREWTKESGFWTRDRSLMVRIFFFYLCSSASKTVIRHSLYILGG